MRLSPRHTIQLFAILALMGSAIALMWRYRDMSPLELLEFLPQNLWLAALILLGFYLLKSLAIVFPLTLLHIVGGLIFPLPTAILVNLAGTSVGLMVGYLMGCFLPIPHNELTTRYPKAKTLFALLRKNAFFSAFFTRVVGILPMDIVSILLGGISMRLFPFLVGSLCGMLPSLLAATILGESASDPTSPAFFISLGVTVLLSVGSFFIYRHLEKKEQG